MAHLEEGGCLAAGGPLHRAVPKGTQGRLKVSEGMAKALWVCARDTWYVVLPEEA